jgi:HEAT repeat protein
MSLEKSQPADDAARLKKLIENLSDDDYTVRESATRALIGAGSTATESIESGAASDDLERASRCKEILLAHKRNDELRRELGLSK